MIGARDLKQEERIIRMKTSWFHFTVMIALAIMASFVANRAECQSRKQLLPFRNTALPVQDRVNDLLGRMTPEEKIRQLECSIGELKGRDTIITNGIGNLAVPLRPLDAGDAAKEGNRIQKLAVEKTRLGIPIIIHDEGLHGLVGKGATSFPQAIGLAATWDTDLMEQVATAIGKEARTRGIRQLLSPVINIARDVRWGRVEETYGEDPYLTSRMGVAFCRSIESQGVLTTPKHYAANVGDGGRDSHPVHFSERLLREIYFPAFKACFQEGHATSVMAAYNALDGLPCSADRWLLTDVLRGEWGFKGFVVSDYGSAAGIYNMHHTAATEEDAAQQAVNAGLDVELPDTYIYGRPLFQAVADGLVKESTIDTAVSRILEAKFKLKLFDSPYADPDVAGRVNDSKEHRALALRAAREATVLLKNENNILPFKKDIKSVAVIGPNADAARLGGYSGFGMKVVSVLEGIKNKLPSSVTIRYAKGCDVGQTALPPIQGNVLTPAGGKEGEHGLKGEYFNNMALSGEPVLVRTDEKVNFDWQGGSPDPKVNADHFSARWTGKLVPPATNTYRISITTDDGGRLYIDGKLLIDSWYDRGPTTDYIRMKMEGGRAYEIRMEYYENSGGAFASLGWNFKAEGQKDIDEAIAAAKSSEAAIIVTGIAEGEGSDRAELDLPGDQERLIHAVAATGTPTIVILMAGSAVTMNNWIDEIPAILDVWYPGEEGGNAIADVLFGEYDPGGKLPITFPQAVGQVPLYYNTKPTGRGYDYVDMSGKPLYPFGHGLSYTTFSYGNLQVNPATMNAAGTATISIDVKNTGSVAGDEVVQLYIRDSVASVTRPLKELKDFKRITLAPAETKSVSFTLTGQNLAYPGKDLKEVLDPGRIGILLGSSSEDIRATGTLTITR